MKLSNELDKDKSNLSLLLQITQDLVFFHDEQNIAYATMCHNGRDETMRLDSEQFCNFISHLYWNEYGNGISKQTMQDAILTMKGKALYDGECYQVYTRIGALSGNVYIYLANQQHQVVRISRSGWDILDKSPVKFVSTKNMRPLPIPLSGGNIELLWKYVNIPVHNRHLVLVWLLESLRLDTDFPILLLLGAQGSAKSTSQKFLCSLIDPSGVSLRGAPRNIDDIVIAAANGYIISFNNLSHLNKLSQDDLCSVSTGGGIGKRELYKNLDEILVDIKRPLIMNGINSPVTASDLISRCIILELPEIKNDNRKSAKQLQEEFVHDYPSILGGLYDLYVAVLQAIPAVKLIDLPRLADFVILGTAMEIVLKLEQGSFLKSFNSNMQSSMLNTIYSHTIMVALSKFIVAEKTFRGTFTQLLNKLNDDRYKPKYAQGWPMTGHGLAAEMKVFAPTLNAIGISVIFEPQRSRMGMIVDIREQQQVLGY